MVKEAKVSEEMKKFLFETILSCETTEELDDLFDDLCTYKEVEQMAQRIEAAKMLTQGKTYAEIIEKTEISSATLSRVSRCVQRGSGGYARALSKNNK
jgi:TrpR-related protein YerC/YecD